MELTVDMNTVIVQVKGVLGAPKDFFVRSKKEKGWKKAFVFVLVVSGFGHILTGVYNVALYPTLSTTISETFGVPVGDIDAGRIVGATLISYILSLGMSFVWGGALKVWLSLFKVDSTFARSYRVMAYSRTPNYILGWMPVVNFAAALYSFYLLMVGVEKEYSVPRRKALIIVVSSILVMFVLSIVAFSMVSTA